MSERSAPYIYRTLRHPSNNVLTHYLEESGVVVYIQQDQESWKSCILSKTSALYNCFGIPVTRFDTKPTSWEHTVFPTSAKSLGRAAMIDEPKAKPLPVPDISYFARRGGLTPGQKAYPYALATGPFDYISESCNGTCTVNHHVVLGLEKVFGDVDAFRDKSKAFRVKIDLELVLKNFPQLSFLGGQLPSGNPKEAAAEAYKAIEKRWPELQEWQPKKSHRPGRPKDEIKSTKKIIVAGASRGGRHPVEALTANGIKTPRTWQKKGCPPVYSDAFALPAWRKEVSREISNLK